MPSIERVFLGWDRAGLPSAAAWLRNRFAQRHLWDLSNVLIVVPGARAGRRLLEIVVQQATQDPPVTFVPPTILTAGQLPEKLYSHDSSMADPIVGLLARVSSLRELDQTQPQVIRAVVPQPPKPMDFAGWLALAQDLTDLQSTLAAEFVRVADVPEKCADATDFSFNDHDRWNALASMQQAYEETLARLGLTDRDLARFAAVEQGRIATDSTIILLGTTDLNRITRQMFALLDPSRVIALVHAPESESNNFDDLGCLKTDAWCNRPIDITPRQWRVVDQRRDQACEVARVIGPDNQPGTPNLGKQYRAHEITVGLGDESAAPMTQRVLELAGVPARSGLGSPAQLSRPALLLAAFRQFLRQRRLADFADLLRHPDLEQFLRATVPVQSETPEESQVTQAIGQWLNLLDRYITDYLGGQNASDWLGDPATIAPLKNVYDRVTALLPTNDNDRKPLPEWCDAIAQLLKSIYGTRPLQRHNPHDRPVIAALSAIVEALRTIRTLPAEFAAAPSVNLFEALGLVLQQLSQVQIPPEPAGPAVELLGWLELPLDDAPALIVTGFNEGLIPQSKNADPFLPDRVRRCLGLTDNRRRLARDTYALTAILHSRPHVFLIAGHRGAESEPLLPSRLLLSCGPDELPERIQSFYHDTEIAPPVSLLPPAPAPALHLPLPKPLRDPITKLHVTAFRDYLACPYRFYLKHVLKLQGLDDTAVELDPLKFGNLAHDVLEALARDPVRDANQIEPLVTFLDQTLDRLVARSFSEQPPKVVCIQREQLRHRLRFFALQHLRDLRLGWRILPELVERQLSVTLQVDGQPFTIVGRIDRIDVHPTEGYRVSDYKSGDAAKKPEETHRRKLPGDTGTRQWIDLQLPLYRELIRSLPAVDASQPVSLGYINLCKDTEKIGFVAAPWQDADLHSALQVAHQVIRNIRSEIFWPPSDPPEYPDDFSSLCCDDVPDRRDIIQRSAHRPTRGDASCLIV